MKLFFSTLCLAPALLLLASCGGMKKSASAPTGVQEFDQTTGTWKPAAKIVAPPPHQESGPLPQVASSAQPIEQKSAWQKVGETARKPLKWVGLAKDEPAPAPVPPPAKGKVAAGQADPAAAPRSPIDPKPGAKSLWQSIGDTVAKPFHWMGL